MSKFKGWVVVERALANARLTTAEKLAFTPPTDGFMVWDTDLGALQVWDGASWGNAADAPVDSVNGQTGVVVLAGSDIAITPTGNLSAADVAAALNELQGDIDQLNASAADGYIAGNGAPAAGDGVDGNYYLDVATGDVYGPKAGGAWPGTPINNVFATNFGSATPQPQGTATAGTANLASREDHVHPAESIGTATDVDITTNAPTVGSVLVWDGANYVPGEGSSSYQGSFTVGDWTNGSPNTYLVPLATHGLPFTAGDVFDITVYENDEKVIVCAKTLANGDVQLVTEGAPFAGRIKISK